MSKERLPKTNNFGLALPPTAEELAALERKQHIYPRGDFIGSHHLYWPRKVYGRKPLAKEFRENRFNIVELRRSDHDAIHDNYDIFPIPAKDVMREFLHEALSLEDLVGRLDSIDQIDSAFTQGLVVRERRALANRERHLKAAHLLVDKVVEFEVLPGTIALPIVERFLVMAGAVEQQPTLQAA